VMQSLFATAPMAPVVLASLVGRYYALGQSLDPRSVRACAVIGGLT
jgi:hypothetical protein